MLYLNSYWLNIGLRYEYVILTVCRSYISHCVSKCVMSFCLLNDYWLTDWLRLIFQDFLGPGKFTNPIPGLSRMRGNPDVFSFRSSVHAQAKMLSSYEFSHLRPWTLTFKLDKDSHGVPSCQKSGSNVIFSILPRQTHTADWVLPLDHLNGRERSTKSRIHTHTHTCLTAPLSRTTWVSQYQKGKP